MGLDDLFKKSLKDLSSMEKQLVTTLPRVAKAVTSPPLKKAFQNHLAETKIHVSRVDLAFESLGAKPATVLCKGMQGILQEGAEHIQKEAGDIFGDLTLLGAGQRVEHYEIAAYFSSISMAKNLGYGTAANLLVENLLEEQKAAELLRKLSKSILKEAAATVRKEG